MTITNKTKQNNHPSLFLQNQVIEKVKEHKHLGLTIQSNLKWNSHIENIAKSANSKLNIMRKYKYDLNRKSLEIIYKSFIRPVIEYGDILWCNTFECDIEKLDVIQNSAMRCVTGALARTNTQKLYEKLQWQPLSDRFRGHV